MATRMTRVEMAHRFTHLCTKCDQPTFMVPDMEADTIVWREPKPKTFEKGKNTLTATIGKPLIPHESGLCYFHLKGLENYFDAKYKLAGKVSLMGEGGLSKCPTYMRRSFGYAGNLKKHGK